MGHTAAIQCPSCSAIQDIEIKDVEIDESKATVTFAFKCTCGYTHDFDDAPLEDIAPFISNLSESDRLAESLGISRESYESYVWPLDIRTTIDEHRRKLRESKAKRDLRSSVVELPRRYDERWWHVYGFDPPIVFDPKTGDYGFIDTGGSVTLAGDIATVVAEIERRSP